MKIAGLAGTLVLASMIAACGGAGETTTETPTPTTPTPAKVAAIGDTIVSGPAGSTLSAQLRVVVTTSSGQPVSGVTVGFDPGDGSGSVSATPVRTDAQGIASSSWTFGTKAGRQTVSVSVSGLPAVTFVASVSGAAATRLIKLSGDGQTAVVGGPLSLPLTLRVVDAFDNAIAGAAVNVVVKTGGGAVTTTSATSGPDGVVAFSAWSLGPRIGLNDVDFTLGAGDPVRFTATAVAGPADTVAFVNADTLWLLANDSASVRLRAADRFGNTVSAEQAVLTSDDNQVARLSGSYMIGVGSGDTRLRARLGSASASRAVAVTGHLSAGAKVAHAVVLSRGVGATVSGDLILAGSDGRHVIVYDTTGVARGAPLDLPFPSSGFLSMAPAGNGKAFVVNRTDAMTALVDLSTSTMTTIPLGLYGGVFPKRSLDGASVFAITAVGMLKVDLGFPKVAANGPPSLGISGFGQSDELIVTTEIRSGVSSLRVLDARTLAMIRGPIAAKAPAGPVALSRDGQYMYVSNSKTNGFDVYRITGEPLPGESYSTMYGASAMLTSLDGAELYVVNVFNELYIFSLADPAKPTFIRSFNLGITTLNAEMSFDARGSVLVVGGYLGGFAIVR